MIQPAADPERPDPDFWNERRTRSRTRARRSRAQRVSRVRTVAALVLVGALAAAWLVTARRPAARSPVAFRRAAAVRAAVPTSTSGAALRVLRNTLPADAECDAQRSSADVARCSIARVHVAYRLVPSGSLRSAYLTAVLPGYAGGTVELAAGSGRPACARGAEDERAWSRPGAPLVVVGRYACRIEQGRASMYWTVDDRGLLAHASAADVDLTSLFAWWESHSER